MRAVNQSRRGRRLPDLFVVAASCRIPLAPTDLTGTAPSTDPAPSGAGVALPY